MERTGCSLEEAQKEVDEYLADKEVRGLFGAWAVMLPGLQFQGVSLTCCLIALISLHLSLFGRAMSSGSARRRRGPIRARSEFEAKAAKGRKPPGSMAHVRLSSLFPFQPACTIASHEVGFEEYDSG